jgi:uncharacterized protein (DUF302 family)
MFSKWSFLSGMLAPLIMFAASIVLAAEGVVNIASDYSAAETMNNFESVLVNKGMKVFARVDHSKGAASVGVDLRPTELIIFGNPKVGSPLMKCEQTVALDLPQKAVVWVDQAGKVWLSYNDPAYLKKRHNISGCDSVLDKISKALAGLTRAAASKQ